MFTVLLPQEHFQEKKTCQLLSDPPLPQTQSLPIMASETLDPTFPEAESPSPGLTPWY